MLTINKGSPYPALHQLEQHGRVRASWGRSENNRQAKYYELIPKGRRRLDAETENWVRISVAVACIVEA